MSMVSNARPLVQPASSGPSPLQPRDDGWPLRYVPLPPPPPAPWRWRWSPWIGIMYGPLPVGLIVALLILLATHG